ncbi:MAG: DUF106 domain-containing protein [Candidatus Diapherotrites archaeon]|nr:DUF106 domain-containing protein [Candidatus Diapherotrites archaeon]
MNIIGIQLIYPDAVMAVVAISTGVSLFSVFVHRKLVDRKKMDEIRKRIEEHQKKYLKAQKEGNQKEITRLEREQANVMKLLKKNFMMSMKPVFITMPVFLLLLWWMRGMYDKLGPMLDLPISIPFLTHPVAELGVANGVGWIGLYIVISIATSLTIELILKALKK